MPNVARVSNKKLLNAANCQGYNFYRFAAFTFYHLNFYGNTRGLCLHILAM